MVHLSMQPRIRQPEENLCTAVTLSSAVIYFGSHVQLSRMKVVRNDEVSCGQETGEVLEES